MLAAHGLEMLAQVAADGGGQHGDAIPVTLAAAFAAFAILQALLSPSARALIALHPVQTLEIVLAVAFLIFLVALPAKRLIDRLASTRTVTIASPSGS